MKKNDVKVLLFTGALVAAAGLGVAFGQVVPPTDPSENAEEEAAAFEELATQAETNGSSEQNAENWEERSREKELLARQWEDPR